MNTAGQIIAYIKDVRETRLVQNIAVVGTNVVSFDGFPIDVSNY
jgi:hypothetical protein